MNEEKVCGIYYIRNNINKKVYIGQSLDVYGTRKKNHFRGLKNNRHFNHLLNEDWKIYGEENFSHGIIEECSQEDLDDLEIYYIKYFKTHYINGGYNLTLGGGSPWNTGKKATEEAKRNQSIAHMGKPSGKKGIKNTADAIRRMSESLRIFYQNNISKSIGYKHTEESKTKMSEFRKGKSPSNKGIPPSEESKLKNSEKHMGKQVIKDRKNFSSQYFGVTLQKRRWFARINKNKIEYRLGYFKIEEDAARAYDKKCYELYGEDAVLNFPEEYKLEPKKQDKKHPSKT